MSQETKRSIITHLYQINRALRQQQQDGVGVGELTLHQFQALWFIQRHQPVKMSQLAEELQITPGSTTLLVDRLIAAGWLVRESDAEDRRITLIKLSPEAGRKLSRLAERRLERINQMLGHVSDHDLIELDRILQLVEQSLTGNFESHMETAHA